MTNPYRRTFESTDPAKMTLPSLLGVLVLTAFVLSPISALMMGYTASRIWVWFVAPQYGAGPEPIVWVGIFFIVGLATVRRPRKEEDEELARGPLWFALKSALAGWFAILMILSASAFFSFLYQIT